MLQKILFIFIFCSFAQLSNASLNNKLTQYAIQKSIPQPRWLASAAIGVSTRSQFKQMGVDVLIEYRLQTFLTFGINGGFYKSSFDSVYLSANLDEIANAQFDQPEIFDPDSELVRLRDDSDSWNYYFVGPSVGWTWMNYALMRPSFNFTMAYASYTDTVNSIEFNGILFIVKTYLNFQFRKNFLISPGIEGSWGSFKVEDTIAGKGRFMLGGINALLRFGYQF